MWFLLRIWLLCAVFGAFKTSAQYSDWIKQYNRGITTSATPIVVSITGATTWGTGFTKLYTPLATGNCNEYQVTLTVGVKFISVMVRNPRWCNLPFCAPDGSWNNYNGGTCKYGDYAVLAPFSIEWVDRSTTAVYTLPTRQNVATNIGIETTMITIDNALDRTLVTTSMDLKVTIRPRETNFFYQEISAWYGGLDYTNGPNWWKERYLPLRRTSATRSLGLQFFYKIQEYPNNNFPGHGFVRRKQPTPPFMFKFRWGEGCECYYCSQPNNCWWFDRITKVDTYTYNWWYRFLDCGAACDDYWRSANDGGPSLLVWDFYEDYRQHRNTATVTFSAVQAWVQNPANKYVMVVDTTGPFPMKLRLTWRNVTEDRSAQTFAQESADAKRFIGLYIVPTFPIQDLWVTIHSGGTRIFTELERRVPFRDIGNKPGQPGWMFALTDMYDAATTCNIVVRYNRRNKIGTTPEEQRASLVRGFVTDNDGDVSQITSPIPKTILSTEGVMGAVAANAIASGTTFGRVTWQSCLTSNSSAAFYTRHMARKLNETKGWYSYYDTTPTPWHKEHLMMTLMMVTDAVSENDYSTAYWTIADAFYPEKPTMIPHFWDAVQVDRLLGYSEIPRILSYELGNWSREHGMIGAAWPWFAAEVAVTKWQNFRAHVRRSTIAADGQLFLPPFVHLFRHTDGTPNFNLKSEWYTADITFQTTADVPFQGELFPNFSPGTFTKHAYFLQYGAVPAASVDSATVPSWDGFLIKTRASRDDLVNLWMGRFSETKKQVLQRLVSVLLVKQTSLPVNVNGLGSTPEQVNMATSLLTSEKSVIAWQIADCNAEYATLP